MDSPPQKLRLGLC